MKPWARCGLIGAAAVWTIGCSDDAGGAASETPGMLDAAGSGDRAVTRESAPEVDSGGSTMPELDAASPRDTSSAESMNESSRPEIEGGDEARITTPNHAIKLDGATAQALFPASVPAIGSTFTVECFFRWVGARTGAGPGGGFGALVVRQEFGMQEWGLIIVGDPNEANAGMVEGSITYDGNHNNAAYVTDDVRVSRNEWHHIALVGTGTELRLYVDGALHGTKAQTGPAGAVPTVQPSAGSLKNPYEFFNGELDEFRISKRARYTASSFALPTSAFTPDADTLALWHFDEGTGNTAKDATSAHNDGTLAGATWGSGYPF
jgi:Concanavalin A-like lectin/glucanases superfamily